ncbi:MAG: alpha/beta hydrolase [Limnochordia bacterium]|jgi:acetyl esterase
MSLDPQVKSLLQEMASLGAPPLTSQTPAQARMRPRMPVVGEPVDYVEDRQIPGLGGPLNIRVYRPKRQLPLPVLVYAHGGGWVLNDLDSHDHVCRALANAAECAVVSVDYRLAPEHRFPAAADDVYATTCWVAENAASFGGDGDRIAVGGDSSGGNLAAVAALMSRDRGKPGICYQLLVYPITDYSFDTPSYEEFAEGYFLTRENMMWFWRHYLGDEADGRHPYASPLRAADLSGLPPAFVITAECDPLRDEGEAYARRLREAGVEVVLKRYEGMIHAFFGHAHKLDGGKEAIREAGSQLARAFAGA